MAFVLSRPFATQDKGRELHDHTNDLRQLAFLLLLFAKSGLVWSGLDGMRNQMFDSIELIELKEMFR